MTTSSHIRVYSSKGAVVDTETVVHVGREVRVALALQARPAIVWVQYLKHQGDVPVPLLGLENVTRHPAR